MAVYFVTGKLGAGKSLCAVGKIAEYLAQGRKVATNLDLFLDQYFENNKHPVTRIPDKPRPEDMELLGKGYDNEDERDCDESKFGLIVLDECGTWLNSREWNDKERRRLIDWFLHARKLRWDVIFLIQSIDSCDKQIVDSLCEHLVICRRTDRFKIKGFKLPKVHIANVYYGKTTESYVERWWYKGKDIMPLYDTLQRFKDDVLYTDSGPVDMRATFTYLPAWHLKGRYAAPVVPGRPLWEKLVALFLFPLVVCWLFVDPRSCKRLAFRPGTFDKAEA